MLNAMKLLQYDYYDWPTHK